MKVLHLNEHLSFSGGIETYLLSLIPLLERGGHESVVAYARGDAALTRKSHHVPLLESAGRRALRVCRDQMQSLLKSERPDVVHVHNVHNVGAIEACLDAAPTVLHAHDYRYVCPSSNLFHRRSNTICDRTCGAGCFAASITHRCMTPRPVYAARYYHRVRWMMANAQRFHQIIAPSHFVADRFVASGFPSAKITVLPYFCPIEPANDVPANADMTPTLLFIGRVRAIKGIEVFAKAISLLRTNVRGLIVGDASSEQQRELVKLTNTTGSKSRLEFQPWASRASIRGLYEQATILAFPSLWAETLGIVGLESLACGVPVVASDVGGVREWLRHNETGLLVPPGDPKALAEAIETLLANAPLRNSMGRNGIALIRNRFNGPAHVVDLLDLYGQKRDQTQPPKVAA